LEHAIHLFQRGDLLVDNQISTCGKATMKAPLKFNKMSGKESSTTLAFSEQNWGPCTWQYFMSVNKHNHTALKEVIKLAHTLLL
ncbi:hypothetical protein F5141DRAFT_982368, partial [Pisolithus sp. B1]